MLFIPDGNRIILKSISGEGTKLEPSSTHRDGSEEKKEDYLDTMSGITWSYASLEGNQIYVLAGDLFFNF